MMDETKRISYTKGVYKYQTASPAITLTALRPRQSVGNPFTSLSATGVLRIESGYAWDGPSGWTVDTKSFMRGSLVHDALYQLCRENPKAARLGNWRELADKELYRICIEDGMWKWRARWVYRAVRIAGRRAARPSAVRPILWAP